MIKGSFPLLLMKYDIDYKNIFYPIAHRPKGYIDSCKNRYKEFDVNIIKGVFKDHFNEIPLSITPSSSWGTSHIIYFVKLKDREYVFRANNGLISPEEVMLAEKVITDKLFDMGIPVNRVLLVDISRKKYDLDYQIEEKFEGVDIESIWDKFTGKEEEYNKISFEIGVLIARMAELETKGYGLFDISKLYENKLVGYHDTFYDHIKSSLIDDLDAQTGIFISQEQADKILELFEDYGDLLNSLPPTIVHHDICDHNIAINPKTNKVTALFDWESACSGNSILDLASSHTWKGPYPRKEILIKGFCSLRELPDSWEDMFNILTLRTVLWKNNFIGKTGLFEERHAKRVEDVLRPYGMIPKISRDKLVKIN